MEQQVFSLEAGQCSGFCWNFRQIFRQFRFPLAAAGRPFPMAVAGARRQRAQPVQKRRAATKAFQAQIGFHKNFLHQLFEHHRIPGETLHLPGNQTLILHNQPAVRLAVAFQAGGDILPLPAVVRKGSGRKGRAGYTRDNYKTPGCKEDFLGETLVSRACTRFAMMGGAGHIRAVMAKAQASTGMTEITGSNRARGRKGFSRKRRGNSRI